MTQFSIPFEGGGRCGAVRYRCTGAPIASYHCYCRDCQIDSGGEKGSRITVNTPDFEITSGAAKWHGTGPDSGARVHRYFCEICGSGVYAINTQIEMVAIGVASLDDSGVFKPTMNFWTSSAQPWATVNEELTSFATNPSIAELAALLASDE